MRPRTVRVQDMSQMEGSSKASCVRSWSQWNWRGNFSARPRWASVVVEGHCTFHTFSALIALGQWLMVVLAVTSQLYVGFSSMRTFLFLLVTTTWYAQCAGNTTVCLFALPLTNKRPSRFAQFFFFSFVTTVLEIDGMKKKVVWSLSVACLAAVLNSIVLAFFIVHLTGMISMFPPWDRQPGLRLTVRVIEMVWGVLDSFAWTLPPVIFCITCMLLEKKNVRQFSK